MQLISLNNIYKFFYNLKNLLKPRRQKWFYDLENYKNLVKLKDLSYLVSFNYIFDTKNLIKKKNFFKILKKKYLEVIIVIIPEYSKHFDIFNFKNKYYLFNYFLDNKRFNRKLYAGPNFLKLDLKKSNKIKFFKNEKEYILKPFFIKKNLKKKLVLLIMVDGLGQDQLINLANTKKFFNGGVLKNAWTNSDWTLPTFGNLITGKYTSRHMCFKPITNYNDESRIFYRFRKNIFQKFKENNFVTGCYSGYVRINPTYKSNYGVDIFKYCKNLSTINVLENVYSQIDLFKNTSNFIFCHLFDSHGPLKDENFKANDFRFHDNSNYVFDQKDEDKNKGPKRLNYGHDEKKIEYSLKQIDWNLDKFLKNLNHEYLKKIDDYTIIVFGDHGMRTGSKLSPKLNNTLSRQINQISFMINDSKKKYFDEKKLVETIDIFPSLTQRYNISLNNSYNIDGKNTLYSSEKKEFQISESIYNSYNVIVRNNSLSFEKSYDLKKNFINDKNLDFYYDKKDKKINKKLNDKETKSFNTAINKHLKKINFY